jgi:hypothetical protein
MSRTASRTTPASSGEPVIVWVFPELVYNNNIMYERRMGRKGENMMRMHNFIREVGNIAQPGGTLNDPAAK